MGCAARDFPPSGAAPGAGIHGPSLARYASRGHPGRSSPCATPPLGLLTGTRAPSCLMAWSLLARSPDAIRERPSARLLDCIRATAHARTAPSPASGREIRTPKFQAAANAPSGGRAESLWRGTSGPDGRERRKGPWMGLVRRPSERRWSKRTRSAAEGRMVGLDLLVPFGGPAIRAMPKGPRPAGRNPCLSQLDNRLRT